jgi:hypothetical protein
MLSIAWGFEFLGYQSQELFKDEPGSADHLCQEKLTLIGMFPCSLGPSDELHPLV